MTKPDEASKYTFSQLRLLAQRRKIKGYSRMTKEELYDELFTGSQTVKIRKKTPKAQPVVNDERARRRRSW